jgi:ribonucleoside-diphosphate reductase alpha chain
MEDVMEQIKRGERLPPPNRSSGYTQEAVVGDHKVILRTQEYEDRTLAGISIEMQKEGAGFRAVLNGIAQSVTIGLQHGVPLETYVESFTFTRFEPAGRVEGNDVVLNATSILDYIFRELAITYLERTDLAHIAPRGVSFSDIEDISEGVVASKGYYRGRLPTSILHPVTVKSLGKDNLEISEEDKARMQGYEAEACSECGKRTLVRNGKILKCNTCGGVFEIKFNSKK